VPHLISDELLHAHTSYEIEFASRRQLRIAATRCAFALLENVRCGRWCSARHMAVRRRQLPSSEAIGTMRCVIRRHQLRRASSHEPGFRFQRRERRQGGYIDGLPRHEFRPCAITCDSNARATGMVSSRPSPFDAANSLVVASCSMANRPCAVAPRQSLMPFSDQAMRSSPSAPTASFEFALGTASITWYVDRAGGHRIRTGLNLRKQLSCVTLIQHASSQDAAISADLLASSLDRRTASTSNAD
jgi:hypothetical protein